MRKIRYLFEVVKKQRGTKVGIICCLTWISDPEHNSHCLALVTIARRKHLCKTSSERSPPLEVSFDHFQILCLSTN
jgi:hypothetical protein